MNVASLFTGGKDSVYSAYLAKTQGHKLSCILTVTPESADSHLLHHPNISWTKLQAESMNVPSIVAHSPSIQTDAEIKVLGELMYKAKLEFGIQGIVHGGIASKFQKKWFELACKEQGLKLISPVWNNTQPEQYIQNILDTKVKFIITAVAADGLDDTWLGRVIDHTDIIKLKRLSKKFGFNMNFEGRGTEDR